MLDNFAARVHNGRRYAPEYSGKGEKTEARSTLFSPHILFMKRIYLSVALLLLSACNSTQNDLSSTLNGGGYLFRPEKLFTDAKEAVSDGYWDRPANLEGNHVIVVDTQLQQAKYYIGGRQVGLSDISSGKAGHGTPRGVFSIIDKDVDHVSASYGSIVDSAGNVLVESYTVGQPIPKGGHYEGSKMNFGMQITRSGIWMHEGIVTSAPESHGCIRLPRKMAKIFFENTPIGTKVIIK